MQVIIVTGLSGAGKSHALRTLEDMGFFCVDNLPPALLPSITSLCLKADDIDRLAVGIDVRSGAFFGGIEGALDELGQTGVEYEILYLQVGNEEVVRRYKETRRSHPMGGDPMLIQSIEKERTRLIPMQARATRIIDTTNMVPHELHQTIMRLYGGPEVAERSILLNFISFGFKRGLPQDADMVLDVRFLPNPFYDPQLRPLNGLDEPVERFIKAYPEAQIFIDKTIELITFLIPHYIAEGKSSLTVAIGCTGGQHRSVCLCQWLCESMRSAGYTTSQIHRDMNRH